MRVTAYICLLLIAAWLAFRRGSEPERRMAIAILLSLLAQVFSRMLVPAEFVKIDMAGLVVDLILFLYSVYLSLHANRIWPLWVASAQLISVSGHFFRLAPFSLNALVYGIITRAPAWIVCISLIVGTIIHIRINSRFSGYPNWMSECDDYHGIELAIRNGD